MGMLRIMSRKGDERVAWDLKKVEVMTPKLLPQSAKPSASSIRNVREAQRHLK